MRMSIIPIIVSGMADTVLSVATRYFPWTERPKILHFRYSINTLMKALLNQIYRDQFPYRCHRSKPRMEFAICSHGRVLYTLFWPIHMNMRARFWQQWPHHRPHRTLSHFHEQRSTIFYPSNHSKSWRILYIAPNWRNLIILDDSTESNHYYLLLLSRSRCFLLIWLSGILNALLNEMTAHIIFSLTFLTSIMQPTEGEFQTNSIHMQTVAIPLIFGFLRIINQPN